MPINIPAAAGKALISDGTQWIDQYPPGYLTASDLTGAGAPSTPTSETSLLASGAISNGWPAGAAVHDMLDVYAAGTWLAGATQTFTLNLYIGGTLVVGVPSASLGSSATTRNWQLALKLPCSIVGGAGAGAVKPVGMVLQTNVAATGWQSPGVASYSWNGGAAVTVATNAAATIDLKALTSAGTNPTSSYLLNVFQARWFPKNY